MFVLLFFCGVIIGIISAVLGVGGGFLMVPLLIYLDVSPVTAIGTSSLAVFILSTAATWHNSRKGHLAWKQLIFMAVPCIFSSQIGVFTSGALSSLVLLILFDLFLLLSIYLILNRQKDLSRQDKPNSIHKIKAKLMTVGFVGGFFAGLFGVGGGIILVPLQTKWLKFDLKQSVRNSLGIVMIGALFSALGHAYWGNVLVDKGLALGLGGILGVQFGQLILPKLSDKFLKNYFVLILIVLAAYIFGKIWGSF